ncbi:conserved hypothetical protein [Methylocella silvestris BL2]|uniref:Uncharacterized protein n=1 Tax=Methylocella silvestris (strain DSM 15510 / CIP 108128 / LMG 27833 / NCIMB 13906 / BL2) TaxID=395965 RepID=B8EIU2_METSB|nr:hypothetical protein [Methylocella silvestris]ACK51909.1 conserved hypothetical protein [Methylocella silvestris BL2]
MKAAGRSRGLVERLLLVVLTLYGLALIVPDYYRLVRPLGAFGFFANNDGLIFDVKGPFAQESLSPAWQAGLRVGDRIDLPKMRCVPVDTITCATMLAVRGGQQRVMPGRVGALWLAEGSPRSGDEIALAAQVPPSDWLLDLIVFLDQSAGVLFLLGAAWLVWIRPGRMTWGFFLYAVQFNPGQEFEIYARLQQWPAALLAQEAANGLFQAAGYAGFILFALRAPTGRIGASWRPLERALPALAVGFGLVSVLAVGSAFGYRTEALSRTVLIAGLFVSFLVLAILLKRRKDLEPQEFQRLRWVIWGCLIGLPACVIASLAQSTSLMEFSLTEDAIGLLFLVNGVLGIFVVEAIRRPRVINVSIPLRRATVLGLLLSAPALFLHGQIEELHEWIHFPAWASVVIASILLFAISRLHEHAVRLLEGLFDPDRRGAEARFAQIGAAVLAAKNAAEIDRLLVEGPARALGIASAAVFRSDGAQLRRYENGVGWTPAMTAALDPEDPLLAQKTAGSLFEIDPALMRRGEFPEGPQQPTLAAPIGDALRCFAVALYGAQTSGANLDGADRRALEKLAATAAAAYAGVEREALRTQIAALEAQAPINAKPASQAGC